MQILDHSWLKVSRSMIQLLQRSRDMTGMQPSLSRAVDKWVLGVAEAPPNFQLLLQRLPIFTGHLTVLQLPSTFKAPPNLKVVYSPAGNTCAKYEAIMYRQMTQLLQGNSITLSNKRLELFQHHLINFYWELYFVSLPVVASTTAKLTHSLPITTQAHFFAPCSMHTSIQLHHSFYASQNRQTRTQLGAGSKFF